MKKLLSIILVAMMLLSSLAVSVFADEEYGLPFTDVKEGAWYYEGIEFCYDYGIVSGMTETTFQPNGTLTRAQFVQMLAMYDGVDLQEYKGADSGFDDVKSNHWFNAPVCWAVEHGYVAGLSETKFGPNEKITREQLARLLYLYAEYNGCDVSLLADLSVYEDEDKVSSWAYEQVQWAVGADIISGTSETTLSPRATATRAQACRMMMTFDIFFWYGYRDISGAYRAVADYIVANGEWDEWSYAVTVTEDYGDYVISLYYNAHYNTIELQYFADYYEDIYGYDYRTWGWLYAYKLDSGYDFTYDYEAENGDYMRSDGKMFIDRYEESYNEVTGDSDADVCTGNATAITEILRDRIAAILADTEYTLEDFFLPEPDQSQEIFDAMVEYIVACGDDKTDTLGSYYLTRDEGDKAYVTEYAPDSDSIWFLYVSEPLPGGTDIYDTNYREHAIVGVDVPFGDEFFLYTYVDEENGIKITAQGTVNDTSVNIESIVECEGISEADAVNMINAAGYEAANYYAETRDFVASGAADEQIAIEAIKKYVCENGIEDTETGCFDLYDDYGDSVYAAEYDPEADQLYIIYAAQPLPGGTDVFDTEYREHAIVCVNVPLIDSYFIYTYENEEEGKTVNIIGTLVDDEMVYDTFEYTGFTEDEVNTMFEEGITQALLYLIELSMTVA